MSKKKRLSYGARLGMLSALLFLAVFLGLRFGSAGLSLSQVAAGLLRLEPDSVACRIVWVVRLPHVAGCLLAGCALAVSGLLLQTATGNPLAGPNVIGVNAGAGFAMVLGMCLAPMAYRLQPLWAFLGAFGCTALIVFASDRVGGSKVTVVLAGVAVSTLLSAGISLIKLLEPDLSVSYNYFSVGGVSGVTFRDLFAPALITAAVLAAAAVLAGRLNLLCLGDSLAASPSAAAAVSFAGLLGFVGLLVPHMARKLTGSSDVRKLLPVCALLGAALVVLADLLGRVLFAPSEIPAGIVTAFIGAPFFFILLLQRRNRL